MAGSDRSKLRGPAPCNKRHKPSGNRGFRCPKCGKEGTMRVQDKYPKRVPAGAKMKCPKCGTTRRKATFINRYADHHRFD